MSESYVIKHQQCPKCQSNGKDKSHDNLAVFSDNHVYCFSCHYSTSGSISKRLNPTKKKENVSEPTLLLPEDSTTNYPQRAIDWINQYELTENTLLLHDVVWSDSLQRLIFPIYSADRAILGWQGRDFLLTENMAEQESTKKRAKWFGRGQLEHIFNILGSRSGNSRLAVTEDIVSAIKVSMCGIMAMPLYGCVIGRERFKRLYNLYGDTIEVLVWLDPDKARESVKEARLGSLCGLSCRAILSQYDPKEHSYEEIKTIL